MKVYSGKSEIEKQDNTVVTIGTFDGLHKGHVDILQALKAKADEMNARSFVITFDPHPRSVVSKDYYMDLITTLEEKKELFEENGVDNLMIIEFTKEFSQMESDDFVLNYIVNKTGVCHIVIGYDHRFGKDRGGGEENLRELGKKYGFGVTVVGPRQVGDNTVSSTKIRKALNNGDIETAEEYLGRQYKLRGKVVEGAKRGRKLGFPTANIEPNSDNKITPAKGVYLVNVGLASGRYYGVMNIGYRPTFDDEFRLVCEVFIFDFSGKIYGEDIEIGFIKKIRDERKFTSKEELIEQINKDKEEAKAILNTMVN